MIELRIIAALSENRVIGRNGDKPWYLPEDLRRFKELTEWHPVIMGRKTFQSIWKELNGKPLPNRNNIVLSKTKEGFGANVDLAKFFEEAVDFAKSYSRDNLAYVIGGETVFRTALAYPLTRRMELTHVRGVYPGDAYFPEFNIDEWSEMKREPFDGNPSYSFVTYRRE